METAEELREFIDSFISMDGRITIDLAARMLHMRPSRLINYLKDIGWIEEVAYPDKGYRVTANQIESGTMETKIVRRERLNYGGKSLRLGVCLTRAGLAKLEKRIKGRNQR